MIQIAVTVSYLPRDWHVVQQPVDNAADLGVDPLPVDHRIAVEAV